MPIMGVESQYNHIKISYPSHSLNDITIHNYMPIKSKNKF